MQVLHVRGKNVCVSIGSEHNPAGMSFRHYLQNLQFAPQFQIRRSVGKKPVNETIRLLGMRVYRSGFAAAVLGKNQPTEPVRLHSFIRGTANDAGYVFDRGREVRARLQDAGVRTAFGSEEQLVRERDTRSIRQSSAASRR